MGPGPLSVSVMMVCLLGAARCAADDKDSCLCPDIPLLTDTEVPPSGCFSPVARFRYKCIEGKVRQAGTSNLITCSNIKGKVQWSTPSLKCIDDPNRPRPTQGTVTTAHTPSPHDIITTSISSTISASTGLEVSPRERLSASAVMQTSSTEPTSVSLQDASSRSQDKTTEGVTTQARTWSATAASATMDASNSTADPSRGTRDVKGTAAAISCVSLIIIFASIGVSLYCSRRRRQKNISQGKPEEKVPMNSPVVTF